MIKHQHFASVAAMKTYLAILAFCCFAMATLSAPFAVAANPLAEDYNKPLVLTISDKGKSLSPIAAENLRAVYMIGAEIGHPETLQAMLLQETNGGLSERVGAKHAPVNKRSYGLMQVQIVAARSVLQRFTNLMEQYFPQRAYRSVTDKEIVNLLLDNDEANIRIAAYHFNLYMKLSNGNWNKAVAAYNMGIGNAMKISNHGDVSYVRDIKQKLNTIVRVFNRNNELTTNN